MVAFAAAAVPVEWEFPRLGNCHEGLAFSDGVTGVLVWGGGETVNLTVGRADHWDHRGGYPWLACQSYTNILAAVRAGDSKRLSSLFRKEVPKGEPRNPYMLPLGRVVVRIPGKTLLKGVLDTETGLGEISFAEGGKLELAMAKNPRAFALKLPAGVRATVASVPATDREPFFSKTLAPIGFEKAVKRADGFDWRLPADPTISLDAVLKDGTLFVTTRRDGKGASAAEIAAKASFDDIRAATVSRWRAFWKDGARVRLPDPVLQRIYDYGMYRFGAMTEPDGVPAGLQGPWLEDDQLVPWGGDYHFNINVEECYAPAYRGGHLDNLKPLFAMILSWRPRLRDNAKKLVGIENGYVLPHSVDSRGVNIGGFWSGTIDHGSAAWVAAMMMKYVRYSGDVAFLKAAGYDYMKGVMNVYRAMMEETDGALAIPLGPSPEWGVPAIGRNPSFQLALAHRVARDLMDAAKLLGETPDPMWADVDRRLPAFARLGHAVGEGAVWGSGVGDNIALFEGVLFRESHRHHSHMAGIYPFDTIARRDGANQAILAATYRNWVLRGKGLWTGWCVPWAAILQVDAGNPDAAVSYLHDWETYFCDEGYGSHHNAVREGYTNFTDGRGVMQMDGQCAATAAVLELLVHEIDGTPEFFRGCPPGWKDVSFENIRLADGRSVSGRRLNGKVEIRYSK